MSLAKRWKWESSVRMLFIPIFTIKKPLLRSKAIFSAFVIFNCIKVELTIQFSLHIVLNKELSQRNLISKFQKVFSLTLLAFYMYQWHIISTVSFLYQNKINDGYYVSLGRPRIGPNKKVSQIFSASVWSHSLGLW